MEREIKFRGKRVDTGEWVYGCLVNNMWHYAKTGVNVCEIITGDYSGDCWEDVVTEDSNIVRVTPESVGQFTGLKDKNGIEIYEGDTISIKTEIAIHPQDLHKFKEEYVTSSIWWDNCDARFDCDYGYLNSEESCNYYEIIGNIHENN